MSKSVVKKEANEVSIDLAEWGTPDVDATDVVIPKILAQQGLSKFVTEGKAKFGDFCNSLTGEVLGDLSKPISLVF